MYNFILPNFYEFWLLNNNLKQYIVLNSGHCNFAKNVRLIGQEGNFPYYYWAGGLNENFDHAFIGYDDYAEYYIQRLGSKIILDCSNPLLTEDDLQDATMNTLLQFLNFGSNDLIISNPILIDYINKNYPMIKLIGSPFYHLYDPNLDHIDDLKRIKVFSNNILTGIPRNKLELSLTIPCKDCLNFKSCQIMEWQSIYNFKETSIFQNCLRNSNIFLGLEEIQSYYDKGIHYFYIDSRNAISIDKLIQYYLQIFIKPEYQYNAEIFLKQGL